MITTLGNIAQLRSGYPFRTALEGEPNAPFAVIQGRDVDSERLCVSPADGKFVRVKIDGLSSSSEHLLRAGDLLFMARGTRNYAVHVCNNIPAATVAASSFHVLQPKPECVDPRFLAWLLNQESSQTFLRANNSGTSVPMVSLEKLRTMPLKLPPLETQRRVADLNALIERERFLVTELTNARRELLRGWANSQNF